MPATHRPCVATAPSQSSPCSNQISGPCKPLSRLCPWGHMADVSRSMTVRDRCACNTSAMCCHCSPAPDWRVAESVHCGGRRWPGGAIEFASFGDGVFDDAYPQVPFGHLGLFKVCPLRGRPPSRGLKSGVMPPQSKESFGSRRFPWWGCRTFWLSTVRDQPAPWSASDVSALLVSRHDATHHGLEGILCGWPRQVAA